jgi:hypothetical protein
MTFKARPHRYSVSPAPTNRARCQRCKQLVKRGAMRLVIHAFVRPNRGTQFVRHLNAACVGPALAEDVMRENAIFLQANDTRNVFVDAMMIGHSVLRRQSNGEVGSPDQPIIRSMLSNLSGGEICRTEQKERTVG